MKTVVRLFLLATLLAGCTAAQVAPEAPIDPSVPVEAGPFPGEAKINMPSADRCKQVITESKKYSGCPADGHKYKVWDMATQPDRWLLDVMACRGFKGVVRYFDWYGNESLKGKIPTPAEMALYKEYGFDIALVFQHNNRPYSTFADTAGQDRYNRDPKEILMQAAMWKMPKGRVVYLGVDSDDHWKDPGMAAVRKYFAKICPKLRAAGYTCGMYGPGNTCKKLLADGMIDKNADGIPYCWMPGATGWNGVKDVLASGKYTLAQKVNFKCSGSGEGKNIDYNIQNTADWGQWKVQ